MTNHERIKSLSVEKIAELLVKEECVDEGDYDYDDEYCSCYMTYYVSPDGNSHYTYEDALNWTIDWLKADALEWTADWLKQEN